MRKLILLMLLLCAVIASGCSENVPPKEDAKNAATAVVQEKKDISFIVYRAASDGSEKLLPEKITMKDNGKSLPENALIALVTTKPQDAKMDDVVPIGTKVRSLKIEQDGTAYHRTIMHDISLSVVIEEEDIACLLMISNQLFNIFSSFGVGNLIP